MDVDAVREQYVRRTQQVDPDRYSPLRPDVWQTMQERQRGILRLLARRGVTSLAQLSLVEVGCGTGANLLEFLRLGFQPPHLLGIELLEERAAVARALLPQGTIRLGNAAEAVVAPASVDIVFQSVVFSSLLDDSSQDVLAAAMWRWVKPGGGVLWYDFTYDNPRNPDVRAVPLRRVRSLFPEGALTVRRVTLAPPIARAVCRVHPSLYQLFNLVPLLRTHLLCWVGKDGSPSSAAQALPGR